MVWREWPVTRAVADMLTPSTRRLATWSNFPTSAAKAAVRCPRVRADRSPADRAAVPPASAPLRRKRAVAHDVEAQFSTVVTPALGAGHPVDRVHRSRVPGGNPRFSPKISEVKATDQQRPAQAPSGVYGMSWEPGPPARHTSARAAWRPQNLDDGAMKKILVGAAAFGCRRGPSGADKTEIPDKAGEVSAETLAVQCRPPQFGSRGFTIVFPLIAVAMLQDDHGGNA